MAEYWEINTIVVLNVQQKIVGFNRYVRSTTSRIWRSIGRGKKST